MEHARRLINSSLPKTRGRNIFSYLGGALKRLIANGPGPLDLTEPQRRDAGIDRCEIERLKAVRRPLIR